MSDEIYTMEQIQLILKPIFIKYNINKAILFGSYAKGLAHKQSDIDILVDSGLRGMAFYGLLEDIVVAFNKNIDLIDVSQIEQNSKIEKEIMESGVLIYGK